MTSFRHITAAFLLALLIGCATRAPTPPKPLLTDPAQAAAMTKVSFDGYKKLTKLDGPDASTNNILRLRAFRDERTSVTGYQIYLQSVYSTEWRFYNEAYDSDGNKMDFISISKKVLDCFAGTGCYYEEMVGLNVSRKYLDDHQDTGIKYKVSGKAGEFTGFLPAAYVKGFLMSIDKAS